MSAGGSVASTPSWVSRLSKLRLSISRLTTRPMAPSGEWAHRYTTVRAKRGSCICGMATSSWPLSELWLGSRVAILIN